MSLTVAVTTDLFCKSNNSKSDYLDSVLASMLYGAPLGVPLKHSIGDHNKCGIKIKVLNCLEYVLNRYFCFDIWRVLLLLWTICRFLLLGNLIVIGGMSLIECLVQTFVTQQFALGLVCLILYMAALCFVFSRQLLLVLLMTFAKFIVGCCVSLHTSFLSVSRFNCRLVCCLGKIIYQVIYGNNSVGVLCIDIFDFLTCVYPRSLSDTSKRLALLDEVLGPDYFVLEHFEVDNPQQSDDSPETRVQDESVSPVQVQQIDELSKCIVWPLPTPLGFGNSRRAASHSNVVLNRKLWPFRGKGIVYISCPNVADQV